MKTIIAGSRDMTPTPEDVRTLNKFLTSISEVVSGAAKGADKFGEDWAEAHGIPLKSFLLSGQNMVGPLAQFEINKWPSMLINWLRFCIQTREALLI